MLRTIFVAMLLAVLLVPPAGAQSANVQPGQKVRVTVPLAVSPRPLTGTVVAATSQYLTLTREGAAEATVDLPWDQVQLLEVSRGRLEAGIGVERSVQRGAIVGAVAGGASGAGYRMMTNSRHDESVTSSLGESTLIGAAVGATLGVLGGVFDASGARENWEEVRLPRLAVAQNAGTEISLAFRF